MICENCDGQIWAHQDYEVVDPGIHGIGELYVHADPEECEEDDDGTDG